MRALLIGLFSVWGAVAAADQIRMAVTTSFHNSGLSEVLLHALKADTGIDVQLLVVGTGQALKLGASGDVDAVLVHAKTAELAWVAAGNGPYRREIMYNDFVIVGPMADPSGVAQAATLIDALKAIEGALFVSRGDDSGTHKAEQRLWADAGIFTDAPWYHEAGSGMGATLNTAVGLGAYVLTDRASWLNFGNKADMGIVFAGDAALFNQYAFLPVSHAKHPHVKAEVMQKVEDWLTSLAGQSTIAQYRLNGEQLFFPNAK